MRNSYGYTVKCFTLYVHNSVSSLRSKAEPAPVVFLCSCEHAPTQFEHSQANVMNIGLQIRTTLEAIDGLTDGIDQRQKGVCMYVVFLDFSGTLRKRY